MRTHIEIETRRSIVWASWIHVLFRRVLNWQMHCYMRLCTELS